MAFAAITITSGRRTIRLAAPVEAMPATDELNSEAVTALMGAMVAFLLGNSLNDKRKTKSRTERLEREYN
jgi:hypothetical protein